MASCLAEATRLVFTTELDIVQDFEEPAELCRLRKRLDTDRTRLMEQLENPDRATAGYLSLDHLYWTLRFAWADVQDYVEEANNKIRNEQAGFPCPEWFFVKEMPDGSIVPTRQRLNFVQTLQEHEAWFGDASYPITAWDEDDHEAAIAGDEEPDWEEPERDSWRDDLSSPA
jgi:hypothetical protein